MEDISISQCLSLRLYRCEMHDYLKIRNSIQPDVSVDGIRNPSDLP